MIKNIPLQQLERPVTIVFTEITSFARVDTTIKNLNTFIDYQEQRIKDLQAKLNTYEIEESVTMKHVQPEPKGYCIRRTPENKEVLNKWANKKESKQDRSLLRGLYQLNDGWVFSVCPTLSWSLIQHHYQFEGFTELFTVEDFFEKVGYTSEPHRKSLGMYQGVEIYEETCAWFIIKDNLSICKMHGKNCVETEWHTETERYSKVYLTPKEANARLKEEVEKKAMDCRKISFNDVCRLNGNVWDYAIELIEKEYGVTYLVE